MALRAYSSPGVTVSETPNPALAPLLANPSVVALVGAAAGEQTARERIVLAGTAPVTLMHTGIQSSSVVVLRADDGTVVGPANYIVAAGVDPNTSVSGDEPYTIARDEIPASAPTLAAGTGTLTGTYRYKVAFTNARGTTAPGPASADITVSAQGISLSAIPVGPAGTTARAIYREKVTAGVGSGYTLVATIADNTATTLLNETTSDATAASGAVPVIGIASGDTVVVAYDYTDQYYHKPTILDDYDDIVDKYGAPFDADGNISSRLSFAARLLFLNGASEIMCVATKSSGTQADIEAALSELENEPSVRFVAVADGTTGVINSVVAHVNKMNAQGLYRQAVVGRDGSTSAITATTLRTAASSINNEAIMYVSPASFRLVNPVTGRPLNVGGHYMASAITGMWAGRDVQFPLTRKTVGGFEGINDARTASDLALDSAAGLIVIEDRGGVLRVRHSVTTAVGSINTSEGSVVRAKYDMAHRLKTTLDSAVVGLVIPEGRAPLVVQAVVTGVLDTLLLEGAIAGYRDVKARLLAGDPTTVEVRFEYTPAFPINNIVVKFTVNTQTGELTLV